MDLISIFSGNCNLFFSNVTDCAIFLHRYSSASSPSRTPLVHRPASPVGGAAARPGSPIPSQTGTTLRHRRPAAAELPSLNPLANPFQPRSPPNIMSPSQVRELAQIRYPRHAPSYGSTSPTRSQRVAEVAPESRMQMIRESVTYRPSSEALTLNLSPRRPAMGTRVINDGNLLSRTWLAPSSSGCLRASNSMLLCMTRSLLFSTPHATVFEASNSS